MRRSSPALFELINGGSVGRKPAAPTAAPGPRVEVVTTEPEAPVEAPAEDYRPAAAVEMDEPRRAGGVDLQRRFSVSTSVVLLVAAGVIALCVLAWSTAYEAGKREAKAEAARDLRLRSAAPVNDPLNTDRNADLPLNPNLVTQAPPPAASAPAPAPGTAAASGDPREAGKNYLQLITTDRREAEGIVKFFGENGVPTFMVALDGSGSAAKNPTRFTVYCSKGITREELQARGPAREELDQAAGRLGRRWKDERKGSSDFSGRIWSKFKG